MTKKISLVPTGELSHIINDRILWDLIKEEIRNHILNLKKKYNISSIMNILDNSNFVIPSWSVGLDTFLKDPVLRKQMPLWNVSTCNFNKYCPTGIENINEIARQLTILLPNTERVSAAFPVLATAYIVKYRKNMNESTSELIYRLIDSNDKSAIDKFMSRFELEPWHQKMPKLSFKKISNSSEPMLRSYCICLLFAALISQTAPKCNPYVSVRIFNTYGHFARLFLNPEEFSALKLLEENVIVTPGLNKLAIHIFNKHLYQSLEVDDSTGNKDNEDSKYSLEPLLFLLRSKIDFLIKTHGNINEMCLSFTGLENAYWAHYSRDWLEDVDEQHGITWRANS